MTQSYTNYRATEAASAKSVPSHWRDVPIWKLFQRVSRKGFADEELLSVYREHGVIPKSSRDDNHNRASEDLSNYQLVVPGDLVVNKMKTWQGSLSISGYRGIVSPAYFVYEARHGEDPRFLNYLVRSVPMISAYGSISSGVRIGQWDLDPQLFTRLKLALPPLAEQRAIADYLDRETAQIDRVVSEHERLIALARERYVASVDLDVDSESPNWVPLRRVAQVIDCAHVTAEVTADSRFPVAGLNEVGGVELNLETSRMTTREYFDLLREGDREPRAGDLVFVRNVSVGRAAVVPSGLPNFALGQDCVLIRPGKAIDSNYMRLALETSKVKAAIEVASKGSTFKRINVAQIRDIPLPLTSIQAQQQVVMKLTSRFNRFRELEAKKLAFVEILAERRAALITAAVTGQIDVSQGRAA